MFQVLKCQVSMWFLILINKYSFESKLFHFRMGTIVREFLLVKNLVFYYAKL